jgi:HEAT repeat protein
MRRLIALCLGMAIIGALSQANPAWAQKKKIEDLLKELDSKTPATRIAALDEVGKLADVRLPYAQKALPQIREILAKDGDVKVRVAALVALGRIESETKDYVPNMLKYLKEDKDYAVQAQALAQLGQYQQEAASAVDPLKAKLKELREANKDQDPGGIRGAILTNLFQINQGLTQPMSIEALKEDKAASVRLLAVGRLTQIGQQGGAKDAAPALIEAYDESLKTGPTPELRGAILRALAVIQPDPKDYLPLLMDTLKKDKDAGVVVAVIAALGRGGEAAKDAIPLVLEAQKNATAAAPKDGADPNGQRRIILESVAKLVTDPKKLVPVLEDSLKKDRDLGVRAAALTALGGLGSKAKDAIPTVVALQKANVTTGAKDGNDPGDLRKLTIETLGKMEVDPKELVTLLTDALRRDKNYAVRTAAVKQLGEIGAPAKSALTALAALQKLPKNATPQDEALAKAAGEAVEKIKK